MKKIIAPIIICLITFLACSKEDEQVINIQPNEFKLLAPSDEAKEIEPEVTLSWKAAIDENNDYITYTVYLENQGEKKEFTTTELSYTLSLEPNETYTWKVSASDGELSSESEARSFSTISTTCELLLPADQVGNIESEVTFSWKGASEEPREDITYTLFVESDDQIDEYPTDKLSYTLDLEPGKNYSWKVSVKRGEYTFETDKRSFSTSRYESFTDARDGNTYKTIKIGEQVWLVENLAYLPTVSPNTDRGGEEIHYYVYGYEGTDIEEAKATNNYGKHGVLYNYKAAKEACPDGWHLPTDEEWKILEMQLGMSQADADTEMYRGDIAAKMMSTSGWAGIGTNESGFNALQSGYLDGGSGSYFHIDYDANYWTETRVSSAASYMRTIFDGGTAVLRIDFSHSNGLSVRCIKNQ